MKWEELNPRQHKFKLYWKVKKLFCREGGKGSRFYFYLHFFTKRYKVKKHATLRLTSRVTRIAYVYRTKVISLCMYSRPLLNTYIEKKNYCTWRFRLLFNCDESNITCKCSPLIFVEWYCVKIGNEYEVKTINGFFVEIFFYKNLHFLLYKDSFCRVVTSFKV